MQPRSRQLLAGFIVSSTLAGSLCAPAGAQIAVRPGGEAKVGLTELALKRLVGRFRWPITCVQPGGKSRQLEEAIVFRTSKALYKGSPAVRATLFGIEAPGASVCLNRVTPRLSDVRGVLYLTFYSHGRRDLGASEFRRLLEQSETQYPIIGGRLEVREIGKPDAAPRVISFEDEDGMLTLRPVAPGSTGAKLLSEFATLPDRRRRVPRALTFEFATADGEIFSRTLAEDTSRWN